MNLFRGRIVENGVIEIAGEGRLRYDAAQFTAAPGTEVQVGIRPEDLIVGGAAPGASADGSPPRGLAVLREFVEELGASRILHARMNGLPLAILQPASTPLAGSAALHVSAEPGAVHLFDATGRTLRRPISPRTP